MKDVRTSGAKEAYRLWNTVFILTMLVYAVGLFIDIMEPDAAVYAEVSMEMHDSGNFLSIFHKHLDWLDKPPFPFWMSAFSYKLFGVNAVGYKFPAVIFILLAAFYTFLFGKKFYSALHGWLAALLLLTTEHIIISNQDVRAEPFMTGLLIMGLYHFASYAKEKNNPVQKDGIAKKRASLWPHLILGPLALACLMMTKGLFTIIPVAAGIGLTLLLQKNWKAIFQWQWLMAAIVMIIFLFPALYGYYQQFDLHPEKEIFGKYGISGVEFFLWTSQWGRFTNTGPIKGSGDPFFFVHTLLWAFLPWSFAAFYALFQKTRKLIRGTSPTENYTYFGFVVLFLIFSLSKFQLSFYLNPLFPLLAIITTAALLGNGIRPVKTLSKIHFVLCCLLIVALGLLHYYFLNNIPHFDTILILISTLITAFYLFLYGKNYLKKIFFATPLIVLAVNYYINRDFYPALMKYQAASQAAHFIKSNNIAANAVVIVGDVQSVADIILHHVTPVIPVDSVTAAVVADKYVFTSPEGLRKIDSVGVKYIIIREFEDFPVTRLTGTFINRKTRYREVRRKFLLKVEQPEYKMSAIDVSTLSVVPLAIPQGGRLPRKAEWK